MFAVVLCSSRALADDAVDIAAARELATEGVVLADEDKCDAAIDKLARAEKLHHAPTILGRLGECQVRIGKLVEGTENLQRVVREPLGPNPPNAFVAARARAQKVLTEAQPKIAKLTIFVDPETLDAGVTVDGVPISTASIGTPRPTDPGSHVVEVRAPGHKTAVTTITLVTAQIASVTLKPEPVPEASKVEPVVPPPKPLPPPKPVAMPIVEPPSNTGAYVALGIGAAGFVGGVTFGLLAIERKTALDRECDDKRCGLAAQPTLDSAQRYAAFSSIGFAVSLAGVAVGTVLLLRPTNNKQSAWVAPTVGLGSIGVSGGF